MKLRKRSNKLVLSVLGLLLALAMIPMPVDFVHAAAGGASQPAISLGAAKVIKFKHKGQGTLSYAKISGNKKITVNKKNGKVTIKKGLKKGTYKVKIKVRAAGNATHKAATRTVTIKIKVK